jgi:hypothetical protein
VAKRLIIRAVVSTSSEDGPDLWSLIRLPIRSMGLCPMLVWRRPQRGMRPTALRAPWRNAPASACLLLFSTCVRTSGRGTPPPPLLPGCNPFVINGLRPAVARKYDILNGLRPNMSSIRSYGSLEGNPCLFPHFSRILPPFFLPTFKVTKWEGVNRQPESPLWTRVFAVSGLDKIFWGKKRAPKDRSPFARDDMIANVREVEKSGLEE